QPTSGQDSCIITFATPLAAPSESIASVSCGGVDRATAGAGLRCRSLSTGISFGCCRYCRRDRESTQDCRSSGNSAAPTTGGAGSGELGVVEQPSVAVADHGHDHAAGVDSALRNSDVGDLLVEKD